MNAERAREIDRAYHYSTFRDYLKEAVGYAHEQELDFEQVMNDIHEYATMRALDLHLKRELAK